jgi:hypothetical protein
VTVTLDPVIQSDPPTPLGWLTVKRLSGTNIGSLDSGVIPAYQMFMVLFNIAVVSAATQDLYLNLNNDYSGGTFRSQVVKGGVFQSVSGNVFTLAELYNTAGNVVGTIYLPGTLGAVNIPVVTNVSCAKVVAKPNQIMLFGDYDASANITRFIFSAFSGNISGNADIYGLNL